MYIVLSKSKHHNYTFKGAVTDHCGNCTGGTTGFQFNYLKKADCAATCGLSELDDCKQCQPKYGRKRPFKDCNGDCFGRAYLNKCGVCVGGGILILYNSILPLNRTN